MSWFSEESFSSHPFIDPYEKLGQRLWRNAPLPRVLRLRIYSFPELRAIIYIDFFEWHWRPIVARHANWIPWQDTCNNRYPILVPEKCRAWPREEKPKTCGKIVQFDAILINIADKNVERFTWKFATKLTFYCPFVAFICNFFLHKYSLFLIFKRLCKK